MSENNIPLINSPSQNQRQSLKYEEQSADDFNPIYYFQSYPIQDIGNYMVSSFYSEKILSGMEILINLGAIQVKRKRKTIESLMDHQTISEVEQLANMQREKKQLMQRQLQILNNQSRLFKNSNEQQTIKQGGLVLSKVQHSNLVQRFKKQSLERQKRHQELLVVMYQRSKEQQEERRKSLLEREKIELKHRREQIQIKLQEQKRQKEEFIKLQRQSNEKIKEIKENKSNYEKFQQRYQHQVFLPYLEEKQKKLRQIKQQKSFKIEEIKQHQKDYLQRKQIHESRRITIKQEWTYQPPPKSERLNVILEEEKLEKIKKIQQKKNQIQQNLSRHAEYAAYLRRNFIPKIDPAKKQQIEMRIKNQKSYRSESLDLKTIGMSYLEEAKKKKKKIIKIEERFDTQFQENNNSKTPYNTKKNADQGAFVLSSAKIQKDDKSYLIRKRQNVKRLAKSIELNDPQKIKQLTIEADKINQSMKQKNLQLKYKKDENIKEEALQLLLSSIQAKIGIIETYG